MLDEERIRQLIDNKDEPENEIESLFIYAYNKGLEGELLMTTVLAATDLLAYVGDTAMDYVATGYALGQYDLKSEKTDLIKLKTGNETVH